MLSESISEGNILITADDAKTMPPPRRPAPVGKSNCHTLPAGFALRAKLRVGFFP